jgi:hypothetical protein
MGAQTLQGGMALGATVPNPELFAARQQPLGDRSSQQTRSKEGDRHGIAALASACLNQA